MKIVKWALHYITEDTPKDAVLPDAETISQISAHTVLAANRIYGKSFRVIDVLPSGDKNEDAELRASFEPCFRYYYILETI